MGKRQIRIGDSKVLESRETADGTMIRRRRISSDGKNRFTTYERIEMPSLIVIKRSGRKEAFDRTKLFEAVNRSVGKFFNSAMEVEEVVDRATDLLFAHGEDEVQARQIGEAVLDTLADMNEVAYVRFASVFQEFKTLDDFEKILRKQREKKQK